MSTTPSTPEPDGENIVVFDMSPQLEKELMRRAKENGTSPSDEAARILEKHVGDEIPGSDND